MATLTQVLEELNTKEAAISTADLSGGIKASVEGTRKQLTRLKDKGYVDGDSKEGWLITDTGRKALEKGEVRPSMIDEGVTPREKFEAIGRRIGITEDRIVLAADIVWSQDYNDVKRVWEALGQADIRDDLRKIWVNSWRAFLQKGIPPELEPELTGVPALGTAEGEAEGKGALGREYIIVDDQPVRVGSNLGDYNLKDAKDILTIRALRGRFAAGAAGQGAPSQPPGAAEKVSDVLTALSPYLNKGTDIDMLKEILGDKLLIQRQEILSHMPQPGQATPPKTFIEQLTELSAIGPMLRTIMGISETPTNAPPTSTPIQLTDKDGNPMVLDLTSFITLKKFEGEERRAEEDHKNKVEMTSAAKEFLGTISRAAARTGKR